MQTVGLAMNPAIAEVHRISHGARKSTPQRRSNDELVKAYNGLEDWLIQERWEIVEILRRIGPKIGLSADLINHLDFIMKRVPAANWGLGECPVFYQSVINQARELGITDRAVRYREQRLADLGFLAFHDSSNGRRYPQKCPVPGVW